jgi:DNA polymerase III subunit epsilon
MDLVVVDVETTGLQPEQADLIEIGAVRLRLDQAGADQHGADRQGADRQGADRLVVAQVTGEFFTLIRPPGPVPATITELTGIDDAMVRRAPPAATALRAFLAFARGAVLVAHNAAFDIAFLTRGCAAAGLAWPPAAVLDTAVLARLLLSPEQVPDCKLATLAGYFGTGTEPCHRALADAQATAEVLTGLLRRVRSLSAGARVGQPAGPPWPPRQPGHAGPDARDGAGRPDGADGQEGAGGPDGQRALPEAAAVR